MPFIPQRHVLVSGFRDVFDQENPIESTPKAGALWSRTYSDYSDAGGLAKPIVLAAKPILTLGWTTAFNPELLGGGIVLWVQALAVFWTGMPVPGTSVANGLPGVAAFLSLPFDPNLPLSNAPSPEQQAQALATKVHAYTLENVVVTTASGPSPLI